MSRNRLPREYRNQVWALLFVLAEDGDPTLEDETRDAGQFDPITRSINTVRGLAMHAVIDCAIWEQSGLSGNKTRRLRTGCPSRLETS